MVRTVPDRGEVSDRALKRYLDEREVFGVTEIETYLQCPRRWLHERVLRPQELQRGIDVRERGSYAHALLAEFFTRRDLLCDSDENCADERALFEHVVADVGATWPRPRDSEEALMLRTGSMWAWRLILDDRECMDGWRHERHEHRFGDGGARVHVGGVPLQGSIDRVDSGPAYLVTDYKSGSNVAGHASFLSHGLVQPIAYALAWEAEAGEAPAAFAYRSLRGHEMRGYWRTDMLTCAPGRMRGIDGISDSDHDRLVDAVHAMVAGAFSRMREGEVGALPLGQEVCRYCTLRRTCDRGAGRGAQ